MTLDDSVSLVKGVGERVETNLNKLGIKTVGDLIAYYPRKYNDYSVVSKISELRPGQVTIKGTFKVVKGRYVRGGLHITEGIISDDSGSVKIVWFNQPYRASGIDTKAIYFVSGLFELKRQNLVITNPSTEKLNDFQLSTARVVPIYPQSKSVKSTNLRKYIKFALQNAKINDILPSSITKKHKLVTRKKALNQVHFPDTTADIDSSRQRLGFEEIFELVLSNLASKQQTAKSKALPVKFEQELAKKFVSHLSFKLTDDQRVAVWQIYQDISEERPMNRLLEGDVGSGKTVVAAMASAMVAVKGMQVFILAPTEILARQHSETFSELLKPLQLNETVSLLVGSMRPAQKKVAYQSIADGRTKIIIGTHALLQEKLDAHKLGLIIIDEQHRFGVDQRRTLLEKAGHMPHMLSMTATPIPRSLALTVYGDLDVSILKNKPKNRKPVITELVIQNERTKAYLSLKKRLKDKEQIFVVCPLIEKNELNSNRSVDKVYKELSEDIYPEYKVGYVHGRMKSDEKQATMQQFSEGKIDVLVSTTVIEVGVDVPNATVIVVESPERFGLAQVHQLRGRVGRGDSGGLCLLMMSDNNQPTRRLKALEQSNDGFALSELDLKIRGPGAIYGTSQHGILDLRMVDFSDTTLIKKARDSAKQLFDDDPNLLQYPQLKQRIEKLQKITHLN